MGLRLQPKPGIETEIKLAVRDRKPVEKQLAVLGFMVLKPRHFERNYLFDFPDLRLSKSGRLLRLRVTASGNLLTFKGPPLRSSRYARRREVETWVGNGALLREILKSLELREVFAYEKYRTVFVAPAPAPMRASPQAAFDQTPIGNYLELEGPTGWIDSLASRLGYSPREYITATYLSLYRQNCRAQGRKPGNMVFNPAGRPASNRNWVSLPTGL